MILIKDRHNTLLSVYAGESQGKYDTYKGSTLIVATDNKNFFMGKYDTYKGSTPSEGVSGICST